MRLRQPVVAATALGLAGAVLPASGTAAEADRHRVFTEDVFYTDTQGARVFCTVEAHLDWTFGQEGPGDDLLSASTRLVRSFEPNSGECGSFEQSSVTLRWEEINCNSAQAKSYTSHGRRDAGVEARTTPFKDGVGANNVSSEHSVYVGTDCSADCDWTHTLTFSSK